jgi:hypothetical protein
MDSLNSAAPLAAGKDDSFVLPDTLIGAISEERLTQINRDRNTAKHAEFAVQTTLQYQDEFGHRHLTSHCIIYPLGVDPGLCKVGNYAD